MPYRYSQKPKRTLKKYSKKKNTSNKYSTKAYTKRKPSFNDVKRYVTRKINSTLETKNSIASMYANAYAINLTTSRVANGAYTEVVKWYCYNLSQDGDNSPYIIEQSAGQGDRIGNRITVVKNTVNYSIMSRPQKWPGQPDVLGPRADSETDGVHYTPQPYHMLVLCLRRKDGGQMYGLQTLGDLFQSGNTFNNPYTDGSLFYQKLNKDKYEMCYRRIHKLMPIITTTDVTSQLDGLYNILDSQHKINPRGVFNLPIPKKLYYNDTILNEPQNTAKMNWFLVFLPATTLDVDSYFSYSTSNEALDEESEAFKLIDISINQHLYYKDA